MVKVHLLNGQTILVPEAQTAKVLNYGAGPSVKLDTLTLGCHRGDTLVAEFKLGQVVGYSVEP